MLQWQLDIVPAGSNFYDMTYIQRQILKLTLESGNLTLTLYFMKRGPGLCWWPRICCNTPVVFCSVLGSMGSHCFDQNQIALGDNWEISCSTSTVYLHCVLGSMGSCIEYWTLKKENIPLHKLFQPGSPHHRDQATSLVGLGFKTQLHETILARLS